MGVGLSFPISTMKGRANPLIPSADSRTFGAHGVPEPRTDLGPEQELGKCLDIGGMNEQIDERCHRPPPPLLGPIITPLSPLNSSGSLFKLPLNTMHRATAWDRSYGEAGSISEAELITASHSPLLHPLPACTQM